MSKSLKQMAYDTIEAHQETIADLRTQLEKANESYKELFSAFESCQGELKKANERVKDLEKESLAFRSILDQSNRFHPNTDKMYSSGFKDAMRLFEDIYLGDAQQALNKFALEQQIEGIESSIEYAEGKSHFVDISDLQDYIEQLRKEQNND